MPVAVHGFVSKFVIRMCPDAPVDPVINWTDSEPLAYVEKYMKMGGVFNATG
jgi:hypothetical protein